MKKQLISVIIACLYSSSVLAATPIHPFTEEDLVRFGSDPRFSNAVVIDVFTKSHTMYGCSAVKVQSQLSDSLYLTAAHCLGDAERIRVNKRFASAYFMHPYNEIAPQYDLAAFIMPGQAMRKKSVRQKLNAISVEFKDKNVLLVDDSIVRGTTSREIVQMARDAGARKVYFASAAPPVRFPNVYGIDMPSRTELIATGRTDDEICREIGADKLVYQDIDDLKAAIRMASPNTNIRYFEASCFDGDYITGDITLEYLNILEAARDGGKVKDDDEDVQLDLGLVVSEDD